MKSLLLTLAIIFSCTTSAGIIELSTDSIDVSKGDNVTIDINILDAVEFDFLTFNFAFDNTLLAFVDNTNSVDGFFADDFDAPLSGALYLSLDGFFDGITYSGSFLLASLNFLAQDDGTANFSAVFSNIDSFEFEGVSVGTPEIKTASVSAPSTAILAGLMLAGLFYSRKHAKR